MVFVVAMETSGKEGRGIKHNTLWRQPVESLNNNGKCLLGWASVGDAAAGGESGALSGPESAGPSVKKGTKKHKKSKLESLKVIPST